MHRMYDELAAYWPLLSPVEEYAEEAALFHAALAARGAPRTLLELGAGGGHNAFHLKAHYEMTLTDRSAAMLAQSRRINPELEHHEGDMRSLRLGRTFDAVFIHDAITYMCTREDLRAALQTAFAHCRPGGLVLIAPDATRERFAPYTSHGGSDEGTRGFRYLEWCWDPDPDDETVVVDYAFLIREESGETRAVHERHSYGLFAEEVWLEILTEVGFAASVELRSHSDLPSGYQLFVGVRAD